MTRTILVCLICISIPVLGYAEEQVISCAIEEQFKVNDGRTERLDPEGAFVLFKLFYDDGVLEHVEKVPRSSRCKDGPSVNTTSDYIELTCESTLFTDYFRFYAVNRYTGEYREEHVFSDGKLVSRGNCESVEPQF